MKRLHAFTMIEALVVLALVVAVVAVLLPMTSVQGQTGDVRNQRAKNAIQLRGIMTAFAMWSDANSQTGDLPGAYSSNPPVGYPANAERQDVVSRFWSLVAPSGIDPLNPKMLVSPKADVPEKVWSNPNLNINPGVTVAADAGFGSNNVSYALLSIQMGPEWHNNTNAGCPLACDRNRGTAEAPASTWSAADWQGCVAWGDVHTTWEKSPVLSATIFGTAITNSNLWAPASSSNAGMVNPGF
jgi:type II secretory pathway pseudopilin PulG